MTSDDDIDNVLQNTKTPDEKIAALKAIGVFVDYDDRVREGQRQQAEIIRRVWPER